MVKMKKAEIGIEALFYVLMAIIFVWILIFGFQKIFFVQEQLSEQERIEIKFDLRDALNECDDPLNKGNVQNLEIVSKNFNSVCVLGSDLEMSEYNIYSDLVDVRDSGDNVALVRFDFIKNAEGNYYIDDYSVMDKLRVDFEIGETFCWNDYDDGIIKVSIECD